MTSTAQSRSSAPTLSAPVETGLLRAHELRQQGRHEQSILCLEDLLRIYPRHGKIWYGLSLSHRLAGNYDDSISFCDQILAVQPGNIAALGGRVDTALRLNRLSQALEYMSAACDAAPDHLPFQLRRCGLLRQAGQIARAQDLAVELHQRQPDLPGLQAELAFIAQADGRPFDCLAACSAALAQTPGDARLVLEKINALTALRRYSEALAQAEAFLAATPDHPAIQLRRGCLLYQLGRAQESIRFLSALAQQQPHNAHILLNLARAYRHGQQHVASLAILDRLLAQDPQHCGALQEKLETLHLAGHAEELSRLVQELADHWAVAVQSAQRLAFGRLLCRGLAHLADDQAGELLRRNRDRLVTLGTELSVDLIWPIYRRADLMGHGPQFDALARALMDKDKIGLSTARAILQASYRAGIPHWHRIGLHVSDRVPAIDRARVLMDLAALSGLPAKALALRHKSPARAGADAGLQIAMLLRQQGRSRVAARYLGLVWRHNPDDPTVLREYISSLCGAGLGARAKQVLAAATLRQPEMSPNWRRVIAQGWAELDHLSRATDLWAEGDAAMIPHADWYVANALSRTEAKALNPLRQRLWQDNSRRHLAPSIQGFLLAEAVQLGVPALDATETTLHAMAVVARWTEGPERNPAPYSRPVPHSIVQFWSQGTPPPQVAGAVTSWQGAAGFAHQLFDRDAAKDFLLERLGADWLRAFGRAGSATEESDFFRLCHLGLLGGIYADCDDWLTGDAAQLVCGPSCLTVFREPTGAVGNNLIVAPPRHPAILWAAICAKRALEERHNETIWGKTGPGLLTRAVAWHIQKAAASGNAPSLRILPRWQLGRIVQFHSPLSYKSSKSYWNRQDVAGALNGLAAHLPPV